MSLIKRNIDVIGFMLSISALVWFYILVGA